TSLWDVGSEPHKGTSKILEQQGNSNQGMRATHIQPSDFKKYDYIIGMDTTNVAELKALAPQEEQPRSHFFMVVVAGKETM
ncbi:low molecular weight phosphotyrosine protein phosphatase, partial [Enterococcus faecalis]